MGSHDNSVCVMLDALFEESCHHESPQTILETIWTVTHFVYTSDSEVTFMSYKAESDTSLKSHPNSLRRYQIDQAATPAAIAKSGQDVAVYNDRKAHPPDVDSAAPSFTQLIRQTGLMLAANGANTVLEKSGKSVSS